VFEDWMWLQPSEGDRPTGHHGVTLLSDTSVRKSRFTSCWSCGTWVKSRSTI